MQIDPVYPIGALAQVEESTVSLSMTVDVTGKPHDVKVVHSTGSKAFDYSAVQAISRWTFAPATQDGRPVEAAYQMQYSFLANTAAIRQHSGGARLTNVGRGASKEFTGAYAAFKKALQAKDQPAASAALAQLHAQNQYEEASYGLAQYNYAVLWGTQEQQIQALRHAVLPDNGAQDFAYTQRNLDGFDNYLPPAIWKSALLTLLNLDLQTHTFSEALDIWARLQKAGVNRDVAAKVGPVMDRIKAQGLGNPS